MVEKALDLSGTKEVQAYESAQSSLESAFLKLTDQQRLYVDARLSGMVPYAAAKAAGYAQPESQAYRAEKSPHIRDAMEAASQVARVSLNLNRDDVLQGLLDADVMAANATEKVAAWREIGRIIGVYEPIKVQHTHMIGEMSDEQLTRLSNKELIELAEQPEATVHGEEAIDAEFTVLQDAIQPPEPIEYDGEMEIDEVPDETV